MSQLNALDKKTDTNTSICRISCKDSLTGIEANLIRTEIINLIPDGYQTVFLDAKEVKHADLSGINEIIYTANLFAETTTEFIFIYRKESVVAKWVLTTGLDKFVKTAIIPAA